MLRFLLALLLLLPVVSHGESILNPLGHEKQQEPIPTPLNLSPNWWQYFDVDKETLEKRKEETQKLLDSLTEGLPAAEQVKIKVLADKFVTGLQTLIDLKGESPPMASYIAAHPEKYTFEQWLSLGKKWLNNQRDLEQLQLKLTLLQIALRSGNHQLDTLFAAYLVDKKEPQVTRLLKSLEIMNMKLNLTIEQLQANLLKAQIEAQKEKLKEIEKEVNYSHNRIDYATDDINGLEQRIAEVQDRLKEEIGQEGIDQLHDQMILINLELQKAILQLGLKQITTVPDYREQIDTIEKQTRVWKNNTELMLQQALKNSPLVSHQMLNDAEAIILTLQQLENEIFLSKFLISQIHALRKEMPTTVGGVFLSIGHNISDFFQAHGSWFKQSLFKLGDIPITPLGIIKMILIILIAYLLGTFFKRSIHKFGKKHQLMTNPSLYILSRMIYYFILVIGFIIAGASIGLDLTAFAFIAGAITVWIGFSLQSIFHNFISGIIILLSKSLNVGDVIVLDTGEVGEITEINLRNTILTTADGVDLVIPNSDLVTKKFTNRTLVKKSRRITVPFRIPLSADKAFIKKILAEAVKTAPITLPNPEPELWVTSYGENFLNCTLAVWVNESLASLPNMSTSAYYFNIIDDTLRAHNIEIPLITATFQK
ncbi:MAG: mechanosensitive ion channel [Verrucomicrobia bacterium]|nr:mechanosensitive ion channel [Verrucomicrobiota bacterium]